MVNYGQINVERGRTMTKELRRCWLICLLTVLMLSVYPLMMGVRVLADVLRHGVVMSWNYPKYVIPYTPISLAVVVGTAFMPALFLRLKRPLLTAAGLALAVFLAAELLLERVLVQGHLTTSLERWQMYMCYQPFTTALEATGVLRMSDALTEVEVLMGEYDPSFKLHFYMISVVLILGTLSCCYGFARAAHTGDCCRIRLLIVQTTATGAFLAMCVLACFTAFFRDGSLLVSPLSAGLMAAFFILLGVTAGLVLGNVLQGRKTIWAACTSSVVTLLMYLGEMALLNGHLYRFGTGILFDGMGPLVLAPVDVLIILLSGGLCGALLRVLQKDA